MKVMFGLNGAWDKVAQVFYPEHGKILWRTLMSDGTTEDQETEFATIDQAFQRSHRRMNPLYVVDLPSLSDALKYLGKPPSAIEGLPEVPVEGSPLAD